MKLAILGSSPIALEAAIQFHQHGASLTWFNFNEFEYEVLFERYLDVQAYISQTGLDLLKQMGRSYKQESSFSFAYWKKNYCEPLTQLLLNAQKVRPHEVISISKRYLAPSEQIEGKTRFYDLFRLIFQVNPQEFIQEQKETNPETYERLSQEFLESLQTNLEMYEDFDLVLDLRRPQNSSSLSITGRALGEGRISKDHLKYGFEALQFVQNINSNDPEMRELSLVGSNALAAEMIISLEEWLKDPRSRLFIVSEESSPFKSFIENGHKDCVKNLNKVFEFMENEFKKEVAEFHLKLREWQALDDFVKVKHQKPVEPIPRLVYFSGHNATAVDQLIDRRRLFLTLEKPEFREGFMHPENNGLDLKTIGVDHILVAVNLNKKPIEKHLADIETGFFDLNLSFPNLDQAWEKDLKKLKGIEDEIFKLFSPADCH